VWGRAVSEGAGGGRGAPTSGVPASVREGGGTATRGRYGGADRWGELGRRREVGSATRRWRGGVRERAVRAPLGLSGLLGGGVEGNWAVVLGLGASGC